MPERSAGVPKPSEVGCQARQGSSVWGLAISTMWLHVVPIGTAEFTSTWPARWFLMPAATPSFW